MVRPHIPKRGLASVVVLVVAVSPFVWAYVSILNWMGREAALEYDDYRDLFDLVACPLILVGTPLGCQLWLTRSLGPVLALGPAGLWIRTRPTQGEAILLAWEDIARITRRRRWNGEKVLVVTPGDPQLCQRLGILTPVDGRARRSLRHAGLTATLTFADRPEAEILTTLGHHHAAAGPPGRPGARPVET
ncbi:hypothetical protein [Micromonospora sp. DT31]|uniref:hypothetical protein n=1 Tax=Micromonospora sp. DT31 TaxID=3393434 RepID=UPI003CEA0D10